MGQAFAAATKRRSSGRLLRQGGEARLGVGDRLLGLVDRRPACFVFCFGELLARFGKGQLGVCDLLGGVGGQGRGLGLLFVDGPQGSVDRLAPYDGGAAKLFRARFAKINSPAACRRQFDRHLGVEPPAACAESFSTIENDLSLCGIGAMDGATEFTESYGQWL